MIIFWKYIFIELYDYHRLWKVQFELNIRGKSRTRKMLQTFTKTVFFVSQVIIVHSIVLNFLQNTSWINLYVKSIFVWFLHGHVLTLFVTGRPKSPPSLPTSFPLQLLQMLELTPKTFWLRVLTLLPHLYKISRP